MLRKRERETEKYYRLADAGPDLDRRIEDRVAEALHRSPVPWKNPPPYSENLQRAQFLLDVMERREGARISVAETPTGWVCSMQVHGRDEPLVGRGDTEALAICAVFMTERKRVRARRHRQGIVSRAEKRFRRFLRRLSRMRFVSRVTSGIRRILFP